MEYYQLVSSVHKGPVREELRKTMMACAAIDVELADGSRGIGSAFHVGDGVYLTARHVVAGSKIIEIIPFSGNYLLKSEVTVPPTKWLTQMHYGDKQFPIYNLRHDTIKLNGKPVFHQDAKIDVAAFSVSGLDPNTPFLLLGGHYDDWINGPEWLLTRATVIGYPPIPTSTKAVVVVDEVVVNAVVDTYRDRFVRFVVSGIPRGGFSGGPAWHEWGFVLGMVTESLENSGDAMRSGYLTVISIEALRECLEQNHMLPDSQKI